MHPTRSVASTATHFGLFVLVAALAAPPAAAQQPVKIRAGWVSTPASLIPLIFAKPGLARHKDKSYAFEPIYYAASRCRSRHSPTTNSISLRSAIRAFRWRCRTPASPTCAFWPTDQDGAPGYYATPYWVRKDSGINRIEDLKGKVVATNGLGSGVDIIMRSALRQHGLEDKRDYTVIEAPFPTHKAVLKERKADLVVTALPFSYDPEVLDMAKILFDSRTGFGEVALSFWTARKPFIDRHRAALVDLLEDYVVALRWYLDPANHKEAAQITANFLKRPPASFEGWLFTSKDFYRDRNAVPNLKALQDNVDKVRELGFIRSRLEVAPFGDLSLVEEAVGRLR